MQLCLQTWPDMDELLSLFLQSRSADKTCESYEQRIMQIVMCCDSLLIDHSTLLQSFVYVLLGC